MHVPNPKLRRVISLSNIPKLPRNLIEEFKMRDGFTSTIPNKFDNYSPKAVSNMATTKLYAIMEAIADRVEMHVNVGEQRDNWNALLLNSINMITLTAATMAGLAAMGGTPLLAFKLSSTLLFSAATGMLVVMNKIQPSQLAEEQRNAARLFKQLHGQVQTIIALRTPTQKDVNDMMEKVLTLDRAYPLPLLGVMLEKFPTKFEPAVWWPRKLGELGKRINGKKMERNGWSEEMELEMREIVEVLRRKDKEDYVRLGNLALKINKVLAISGPVVSGIAAIGSAFVGSSSHGSLAMTMAVVGGALATIVNTLEHGGQVGMVLEMYRNCAGFFSLLEESIESTLEEGEVDNGENGELFQMKVALKLGRSLSQLRDLAKASASSRRDGNAIDEFGSKLF
ncbi:probable F-box protein At4g22030 [Cornus florida]|uniref:probable F-box protein At4g22030 n=1 Tax=Cornus florida TaxID=4283 RepID=UPI002899FEF1|nr:probable F-box protein At4g22030 [Cornus florida]